MNARVIVPFADYFEISAPHRIDAILNVNNYDEVKKGDSVINIFSKPIDGYKIFESGKRMAKGTTGEVGMTESYFSNPFGAVQFKDEHDKIANAFFNKFKRYGVIVGEIKTQLGLEDKTKDGPLLAAKGLLDLIKKFGGK
jgi:hypothetical protein